MSEPTKQPAEPCLEQSHRRRAMQFVADMNEGGWEIIGGLLVGAGKWGGTVVHAETRPGDKLLVQTDIREFTFDVAEVGNPDAVNTAATRRRRHVIRANDGPAVPMLEIRKKSS